MDDDKGKLIMVNLLKEAVESEGCNLTDVDFDYHIFKVDVSEIAALRFDSFFQQIDHY